MDSRQWLGSKLGHIYDLFYCSLRTFLSTSQLLWTAIGHPCILRTVRECFDTLFDTQLLTLDSRALHSTLQLSHSISLGCRSGHQQNKK
jgi:hypothetical protein